MPLKVAKRGAIPPFIVMDVMRAANERAAAGGDVLHLEVGQPGTPAPLAAREAAKRAMDVDRLGYSDAFGLPALRQGLADYYQRTQGLAVPAGRMVATTGSSGGFVLAFLAAFEAGDRVALAAPGYPAYRNILTALGIEVIEVPVGPDSHFQPTPEILDATGVALDGLIIASPSNPTGSMIDEPHLKALVDYCAAKQIRLISDEIYHGITYGAAAVSALKFTDDAIIINSFSKYFSMTGWRLGWMVVPEDLLRSVECLAQNLFISPPAVSQHAGVGALGCGEELDQLVAVYARNREILLGELPKAGFERFAPPDGAFYLYADVAHMTNDSPEFCRRILAETGVAITPGVDFDPARGNHFVRFSFAGTPDDMAAAAERLIKWRR